MLRTRAVPLTVRSQRSIAATSPGGDHVGLVHDEHVGEHDLLVPALLPFGVEPQEPPVDEHRQAVQTEAPLDLLIHQEGAHDRPGIGGARRFDQDTIVLLAAARDAVQRANQIAADGPAYEAVIHVEDLFVGRDQGRVLDDHLADLILYDEDPLAADTDDVIDQRRLARTHRSGEDGDGDLGHHCG